VARMYDYYLGGHHNFEVDRVAAEAAMRIYPDLPLVMQANRFFLRRAVRFLLEQGIAQFLDVGSGIPTVGSVHEVAQAANPEARVVYVDIDPVAVAHSTSMLRENERAHAIVGDTCTPDAILRQSAVQHLLGTGEPIGLLLVFILHFVSDDRTAKQVVRTFRDALPANSYMVITHATQESIPAEVREQMERLYERTSSPIKGRSRAMIMDLFEGWELVEPGLVPPPQWRPEDPSELFLDQPERSISLAGVARKV
jgi:S-adenosyl methyltransferase